jgi:hypothetical protein
MNKTFRLEKNSRASSCWRVLSVNEKLKLKPSFLHVVKRYLLLY